MSADARSVTRLRLLGAATGAALATVTLAPLLVLRDHPVVGEVLPLWLVLGPDALVTGYRHTVVAASGPLAAAVSGWYLAPRAASHPATTGAWMAATTFALAVTIGVATFVFLPAPGIQTGSLFEGLSALPIAVLAAVVAFAPLLIVALVAGFVWARVVAMATGDGAWAGRQAPLPLAPVLVAVAMVAVGWLFLATIAVVD